MDDSQTDIAKKQGISYGAAAQVVSRARRRAALAARAVIGASLAWLARITLPRDRSRATHAAAQVLQSSQNLVLAAVVVFTAGSLARSAPADVAPAASGGASIVPLAPTAAGQRMQAVRPAAPHAAAPAAPKVPVSALPAGYGAVRVQPDIHIGTGSPGSGSNGNPVPPQQPLVVHVTPPGPGTTCPSVGVAAGPGSNPDLVSHTVSTC
jgi:hypothetical protein